MRFVLAALALFLLDLGFALLFPSREAGAGAALSLDLPELVRRSELVVEARVLAAHPLETREMLWTEYLLEVSRTLKGRHEAYRSVRLPGGLRADGSGLAVSGVPELVPGEEALLFLQAEGEDGQRLPTGLAQGKLSLRRGADGSKLLVRDASALRLLRGSGAGDDQGALVDYAAVVAAIEAAANAGEAGR